MFTKQVNGRANKNMCAFTLNKLKSLKKSLRLNLMF